ncbi:MAG: hypothetical protein A3D96_04245 [Chlamydiae bacterium RIFCSPHIGHO2_12_FULL_44_59]|nr:MAG: hypothetical protein A2796_05735 [Chlamydiae bacterium RIFCSPHIGHO2_01_FULL_44_39]OGN57042.1 MAG: hypothetical protein A3C42_00155 [Chlamydiae bacterium RIFCSPHIGHO2_02_FULL_45_9]OGN60055.1 MAG: hypothetical protein A3D96_04245 [Chlamydiae bacterium RIFCSPHIGHO2_12_FULL_44_59]OGN66228.1 MAG: hypothetical protein A2978_06240 [Chlamydiae bacterium RIFCSPLOWO2_01_FULL_44_52]OGN68500.1 MAG: hypothetical protein A3I67_02190 [Chlamydiae bacterium RIFCSPLOWO2_02_FULL_45_22]OGN70127.1 MAG: hyp
MKKVVATVLCLTTLAIGCQQPATSQSDNSQKMRTNPPQEEKDYHERRVKSRANGGCCGVEGLKAPESVPSETAQPSEVIVKPSE